MKIKNELTLDQDERIIEIEIERLRDFSNHPFHVTDDKDMAELSESIEKYGIITPLIVRPMPEGVYEIISGHRRKHVATLLGYRKVPVIIRVLNDDDSIVAMVDSNLQRERISYSEKAFAYKMKNDAMKRPSGRRKNGQYDHRLRGVKTIELIAKESGESYKQIQRYIKLTNLIPELLKKLDNNELGFSPAVYIAYLTKKEQRDFLDSMEMTGSTPSLSQAKRIMELSKSGNLTMELMLDIISEVKGGIVDRVTFTNAQLHKYFPADYSTAQMKSEIIQIIKKACEERTVSNMKGDTKYV